MRITYDTGTETFDFDNKPGDQLYFAFRHNGELPVDLRGVTFDYSLKVGDKVVHSGAFPVAGKYVSTDQDYAEVVRVPCLADEEYTLHVHAEKATRTAERTLTTREKTDAFSYKAPRPTKPHESWTWATADRRWEAPVAYPDDGKMHQWDEKAQKWTSATLEAKR